MTNELSTHTNRGVQFNSYSEGMKLSELVSKSAFCPKEFKNKPGDCFLAMQAGIEINFEPLQALQSIAVVNGKPSLYGDAALALCKASQVCEYITEKVEGEGDKMVATCEAKRKGYPQPSITTFTVEDAKNAGLWKKAGPWSQYPKRMMQMRARGFALRDAFPDVLKGLITTEEAADYPTEANVEAPRRGTVEIRPAFPQPRQHLEKLQEEAEEPEDENRTAAASRAIQKATEPEQLDRCFRRVEEKLEAGEYEDFEADDLKKEIRARWEELSTPA